MRLDEKLNKVIHDIYRELYNNSTPKADFDKLVEEAELDSEGRKIIPFMNYEIEQEKMDEIIDKHCKENALNKRFIDIIKANVYLGCSPRTKIEKYL